MWCVWHVSILIGTNSQQPSQDPRPVCSIQRAGLAARKGSRGKFILSKVLPLICMFIGREIIWGIFVCLCRPLESMWCLVWKLKLDVVVF